MVVEVKCSVCGKTVTIPNYFREQYTPEDWVYGAKVCQNCQEKAPLDSYLSLGNPVICLPENGGEEEVVKMTTYVLNALIPPANGSGLLKVSPATIAEVRQAIAQGAQCFVGHPATAKLLNITPSRGEAKPREGDIAYVLRLRFRPVQSGQEVEVREEDLEVLRVEYLSAEALHTLNVQGLK